MVWGPSRSSPFVLGPNGLSSAPALGKDGQIFQDAYLVPLNPDREIYLIPKIGGG
jgi:hypothetical protein